MQNKKLAYIIGFSIIGIACLWAFFSAGFITKDFKLKMINEELGKKEVNIENLLVTETKDGQKLWELFADSGYYDNVDNIAYLNSVIGNFYQNGVVVASFISSQATYNASNKQIILYDNTYIVYKDGSNVKADRIVWTGKDEDIKAYNNIRLEKPKQLVIYGNEAVLKHDFSDLQIIGRTRMEFYGKGKRL